MKLNVQRAVYFSFIVNVRKSLTQPARLEMKNKKKNEQTPSPRGSLPDRHVRNFALRPVLSVSWIYLPPGRKWNTRVLSAVMSSNTSSFRGVHG